MLSIEVFYTADVVTPDGSDTGVYGDPCEPGHGATLEGGWVDMDHDQWTVYDSSAEVRPDRVEGETVADLAEAVADTMLSRIGVPESLDNHSTIYGSDADHNYRTGQEATRAAPSVPARPRVRNAQRHSRPVGGRRTRCPPTPHRTQVGTTNSLRYRPASAESGR